MTTIKYFVLLNLFVIQALVKVLCTRTRHRPHLRDGLFSNYKFIPIPEFTDEFNGKFNDKTWIDHNPRWLGRQPGLFSQKNVRQSRGRLELKGRYEDDNSIFLNVPPGYENFSTAFVMTRSRARYGYIEVRAKPGNSRLSSAFWASLDTPRLWTEIDVFEIGGGAIHNGKDHRSRVHMNIHVFRDVRSGIYPGKNEISSPTFYRHSALLRETYHTYAIDWSRRYITWIFDGRPIRRDRNRFWRQALPFKLDVETMPYWFGLPSRKTLPAKFRIKYIRGWSRRRLREKVTIRVEERKGLTKFSTINLNGNVTRQVGLFQNTLLSTLFAHGPNIEQAKSEGQSLNANPPESDNDEDVEMQVWNGDTLETAVRRDGLQRMPIPGSSERVYEPVRPPLGMTWQEEIQRVNQQLDDVFGVVTSDGMTTIPSTREVSLNDSTEQDKLASSD